MEVSFVTVTLVLLAAAAYGCPPEYYQRAGYQRNPYGQYPSPGGYQRSPAGFQRSPYSIQPTVQNPHQRRYIDPRSRPVEYNAPAVFDPYQPKPRKDVGGYPGAVLKPSQGAYGALPQRQVQHPKHQQRRYQSYTKPYGENSATSVESDYKRPSTVYQPNGKVPSQYVPGKRIVGPVIDYAPKPETVQAEIVEQQSITESDKTPEIKPLTNDADEQAPKIPKKQKENGNTSPDSKSASPSEVVDKVEEPVIEEQKEPADGPEDDVIEKPTEPTVTVKEKKQRRVFPTAVTKKRRSRIDAHCDTYSDNYLQRSCRRCSTKKYVDYFKCPQVRIFKAKKANDPRGRFSVAPQRHFPHSKPVCYWQCSETGKAYARPCAKGTRYNPKIQVCV